MKRTFGIIYRQCTKSLRSKMEAMKGWTAKKSDNDLVGLIKVIRVLSYKCDNRKYQAHYL